MRKPLVLVTILTAIVLSSYCPLNPVSYKVRRVVIDAGHGGKDPGCIGVVSHEKDVAFAIAHELGRLIQLHQPEVKVIYTRQHLDEFIPLQERARIANRAQADLFISIHCNANTNKSIYGTETYVMGIDANTDNLNVAMRENASILLEDNYQERYNNFDPNSPMSYIMMANYQQAYQENSLKLARKIEDQFATSLNRKSRGVKQERFIVLAKSAMPSVLVEVGYLSHKEEELYLNSQSGKSFSAACIYRAFRDYKNEVEGTFEQ